MKKYLILILLIYSNLLYSQISNIRSYCGHGENVDNHDNVTISNYSISVITRHSKNKDWYNFYKQPKMGYFLIYSNYNKNQNRSYSIYPAIIFKGNTKLSYEIIVGAGLTYFDTLNFKYSNYLSTKLNWLFTVKSNMIYYSKYFNFLLGVDITHNSNSSIHMPNNGLNYITYFIGLEYNINKKYLYSNNYNIKYNKIIHKKYPFNLELEFGIGPKYFKNSTNNFIFSENELIYNISTNISKRIKFFKPKIGYKIVFYKSHFYDDTDRYLKPHKKVNNLIYVGNDFILGKISIILSIGYLIQNEDLLAPYRDINIKGFKNHFHEQLGIIYNIYDFGFGCRLNARWGSSEYMELYLKYNIKIFNKKYVQ